MYLLSKSNLMWKDNTPTTAYRALHRIGLSIQAWNLFKSVFFFTWYGSLTKN